MALNEDAVREALARVKYPGYSRDIVSFGLVKDIAVAHGAANVAIHLSNADPDIAARLKSECEAALTSLDGVDKAFVEIKAPASAQGAPVQPNAWSRQNAVPGVGKIVAVASGKGGVGKSTCAVNLACALKQRGASVGLLDCDIYGPSVPLMMGVNRKPALSEDGERMIPLEGHGVKLMSIGFLLEDDQPVIWRGPMIMKTIQQFVLSVEWGDLDYLLVDLPPGTGDAQLSLCQTAPLSGGVVVTTPQEASLGVVRKGIAMFEKVNVPILGLVENMSYYTTPGGDRVEIFGHGGGKTEADCLDIPFLGEVPIFTEIREGGDEGLPVVARAPQSPPAQAFLAVADAVARSVTALGN